MKILDLFFFIMLLYPTQIITGQEIDDNKFEYYGRRWQNADFGILLSNELSNKEIYDDDIIVERLFENKESNTRIYYIGANYRGNGVFWIYNNGVKNIILETYIRYGPAIIWHGGNIAEIIIPTGSPFTHSFFFDFEDYMLSENYSFPIYFDIENKAIIVWGNEDFELYDIKTNELVKIYYARRQFGMNSFWPYIQYYIERINLMLIFYYNDPYENNRGIIILELKAIPTSPQQDIICTPPRRLGFRMARSVATLAPTPCSTHSLATLVFATQSPCSGCQTVIYNRDVRQHYF
jgi:hypothetical protein